MLHLVLDVLKYTKKKKPELEEYCHKMLDKHYKYIRENGIDMPEVKNWKWK